MIDARGVAKRFGEVRALAGVDFNARDGQVTGLLGHNGAGKTTLLRVITGLVSSDAGSVLVDGIDVRATPKAAHARLAVLSDARGLYARLTARENIRYYGQLHGLDDARIEARVATVSAVLDLGGLLERTTQGFSQGERMKVAIARALIHDPPNVLLDEPSNGLDIATVRALRRFIRQLADAGKCVVFSSHVMQEVRAVCDEIVILAAGEVRARGTAEQLIARAGTDNLEDAFVELSGETEA